MYYVILEKSDTQLYHYIDFDRTLATHKTSWGIEKMGKPIPKMMEKVKKLLQAGEKIKIFTARAGYPGQKKKVQDWLEKYGLPRLPVTNVKGDDVKFILDDKARQVKENTGVIK